MTVPRDEMNRILSEVCDRYDLDYWVWTPVVFDLRDEARRKAELEKHASLYRACPRLNAGAAGEFAPYIEHPEQVKRLVGATKLSPLKGERLNEALKITQSLAASTRFTRKG